MDGKKALAVVAGSDFPAVADGALVHRQHRGQLVVHTPPVLFHTHAIHEQAGRCETANARKRTGSVSFGRHASRVRHASAVVALHFRTDGVGIGGHALVAGDVVVGEGVLHDLALDGHALRA